MFDAASILPLVAVLTVAAFIAGYGPVTRTAKLDPFVALRRD
jgi:hypothetical protein